MINIPKIKIIVFVVVGLGIAVFVLFSEFKRFVGITISTPTPSPRPIYTPTLEGTKSYLLSKAVLKFPEVKGTQTISLSQFPEELAPFITSNYEVSDLVIKRITYVNNAKGFQVTYSVTGPALKDLYSSFHKSIMDIKLKWELIRGERANLYAIMEIRNPSYNLRAALGFKTDTTSDVVLDIIAK